MKVESKFNLAYRDAAPLAPHARQTLGRPAGLLAHGALGVGGQVALAPMMPVHNVRRRAVVVARGVEVTGHVGGCLAAVRHCQALTIKVNVVLAYFLSRGFIKIEVLMREKKSGEDGFLTLAFNRGVVLEPLATYVAELALELTRLRPIMSNWVLFFKEND
jgi:hypothetical protein